MIAVLPWVVAGFVLVNALTWRRPRPVAGASTTSARVLIPARDEALRIGPALAAATAQAPVTVLDDRSTDDTAGVALRAGATVISGEPLPAGWVGKPWAVQQLGQSCPEDVLVLLDADVVLAPGAVAALVDELRTADVITVVPRQVTGTLAESLILPLLHLTYEAWLPLALIERTRDPRILAANGQILAMRRATWDRLEGFGSARNEVVDDMAFCRAAKAAGLRVRFVDGFHLGATRMYDDASSLVRGFSKNLHEGLGSTPALIAAVALYVVTFVLPYAAALAALAGLPVALGPALAGVAGNLFARVLLAVRHRHSVLSVVLHPLAVLALCGIAANSWRWSRRSAITWAGRVYRARSERA
jgi:chlorobactene glucosyltransferase